MSIAEELEKLIAKEYIPTTIKKKIDNPLKNTTAQRPCNYEDFIKMVEKVKKIILNDVLFIPDDEIKKYLTKDKELNQPIISYKVHKRRPYKELNPLERHDFQEITTKEDESRIGTIFAQRMSYTVQFNIFSSAYSTAETVMNIFEDGIQENTGYFKKNGVVLIYFVEQLEDDAYSYYKEMCSCRHLRYTIILEKQWVDFETAIESVEPNLTQLK